MLKTINGGLGKMTKCDYNEETLNLIALALVTRNRYQADARIEGHYLVYLMRKLKGFDSLGLDSEVKGVFEALKQFEKTIVD